MVRKIFFLLSCTIVAIAAFVLCVYNYNPFHATNSQFAYFYLSFFVSLSGLASITIILIRLRLSILDNKFWPSIRQGIFVGLAALSLLFLKGLELLDLWVGIPTIIAVIMLELFFQTKRKK